MACVTLRKYTMVKRQGGINLSVEKENLELWSVAVLSFMEK